MSHKTLLALCFLIVLPLSFAFGQGGGNGKAMSPVGTWDLEYEDPNGFIEPYKVLWTLNFGGTSVTTAQGFPFIHFQLQPPVDPIVGLMVGLTSWGRSTGHGTWEKVDSKTYIHTVFTLIPHLPTDPPPPGAVVAELSGYVKVVHEFTLIDKDTIEGWCVISILKGRDPFNPVDDFSFLPQNLSGKRLRAEGPMP